MKTESSFGSRLFTTATFMLLVGFLAEAQAGEPTRVPTLSEFQHRFGGTYVAGNIVEGAAATGFALSGGYDISAGDVLLGFNAGLDFTGTDTQPNWQAGLRARMSAPFGKILPYVQGGIVFDGKNTGWEVGAGLALSIDQRWSVEFGAAHVTLGTSQTSTLRVGLRFDIPTKGFCDIKELCPPPPPPKEGAVK